MQKFKQTEINIKEEEKKDGGIRVMKPDTAAKPVVSDFKYSKIKSGEGDYSSVKAKYGTFAVTDAEQEAKARKDRRFSLSPLLRGPLSVEAEEKRALDEKVKSRVQALAEEARKQAHLDGYQDGLKKGYDEAYQQFKKEAVERVAKLDQLLSEMEGAKEDIFRANERFLVELIFRISKLVLLRELTTDKDFLLRLTKHLIDRVGVRENITVRVNPKDLGTISMLKDDLQETLGVIKNLNVEGSNQVKQGGCIVETEWNAIDASIDTQLQGIYDALVGKDPVGSKE